MVQKSENKKDGQKILTIKVLLWERGGYNSKASTLTLKVYFSKWEWLGCA